MTGIFDFDDRQSSVYEALIQRSSKLAGMYLVALQNLGAPVAEGSENARISVICHCMRELMANLPSVLAEEDTSRPKRSSSSLTQELPGLLEEHPSVDLEADQDSIPIPRLFARAISLIIKTASQENGRNIRIAAMLITGGRDEKHSAVRQWNDAYRFFVKWAHLDRGHEGGRPLPSVEEIGGFIEVVEDVILSRTAAFFENVHAIDDLLAEINDQKGDVRDG